MAKHGTGRPAQGRPGPTTKLRPIWGQIEDREIADEWIQKGRAKWLTALAKTIGVPACELHDPMDEEKVRWLAGFTLKPERLGGFCGGVCNEAWGYDIPSRALPEDRPITAKEAEDSLWPGASRELALKFSYLFVNHPDEAAAFWSFARARWGKLARQPLARARWMARQMHFEARMMKESPPTAGEVAAATVKRFGGRCETHTAEDAIKLERRRTTRGK